MLTHVSMLDTLSVKVKHAVEVFYSCQRKHCKHQCVWEGNYLLRPLIYINTLNIFFSNIILPISYI